MEEDAIAVCLYSKYSQRCKEFMDNIREEHDIKMLCIDHKDVRDMISRDQNGYHVKTVPCIFLMYSNGRLEKYEGSDAFVWLRKITSVMDSMDVDVESPPPQQQSPPPPPSPPQPSPQQPSQPPADVAVATETMEQLMEKELSLRRASDQVITRKQDNIKEIAQMMQRQRESEDENLNPPPPGSRAAQQRF